MASKSLQAERTRILEIVGFSISLTALILSLIIFWRFRSLRNIRTRIHKNLFVAMVIQVLIRLILYIDQALMRANYGDGGIGRQGIDNTPFLCEACYIFLEYARTAMFMWMFIEGLYLHNMVTVTVFQVQFPFMSYVALGWGGPIFLTAIWATITATYQSHQHCWWGYNLTYSYWILEGPRLTVILPFLCEACYIFLEYARTAMFMWMFIEGLYLHNMVTVTVFQVQFPFMSYVALGWGGPIFLTAIWATITATYQSHQHCWWGYNLTYSYWILEGPRLTVILLRQSHTSDIEQVRKAVRAAVVLLPLLGITNIISMMANPLKDSVLEFALWSYITHFLTSFQGFFIALLYCFLNGEVRCAIVKSFRVYVDFHGDWATQPPPRRQSFYSVAYTPAAAATTPTIPMNLQRFT
uniref:G-protein coupled receptors family 2 profile 2 domain-containing protein n=1 Tax=Lutzomyia longipalpis TaxID=7200 RepID=A0A1B0CLN9_LUTLO